MYELLQNDRDLSTTVEKKRIVIKILLKDQQDRENKFHPSIEKLMLFVKQ